MSSFYIYGRNQDNGSRPLKHFKVFTLASIGFGLNPKTLSFTRCTIRITLFKHIQTYVPLILDIFELFVDVVQLNRSRPNSCGLNI